MNILPSTNIFNLQPNDLFIYTFLLYTTFKIHLLLFYCQLICMVYYFYNGFMIFFSTMQKSCKNIFSWGLLFIIDCPWRCLFLFTLNLHFIFIYCRKTDFWRGTQIVVLYWLNLDTILYGMFLTSCCRICTLVFTIFIFTLIESVVVCPSLAVV